MKHDFTSHDLHLPELTLRGMLLGALITVIFTASNVYLGLKVGLTFSSSIPAAIISMAILRFFKDSNVLENNMVQTQASAAGTLSAIIFILPGLLMLGYWNGFPFWQTFLLCACGGSLGVLFTIPLRRAMVVNSDLPYPEGRAAAEILKVGSHNGEQGPQSSSGMTDIVSGGFVAGLISLCANGFKVLGDSMSFWIPVGGKGITQIPLGFSTALLGAGYLIGIASGIAILVGVLIAWAGFVPYFTNMFAPDGGATAKFAMAIWKSKVRFIGAGAIGIAAIWTLITLIKPIIEGMKISVKSMNSSSAERELHRMDTDMSTKSVLGVFILIGLVFTFWDFVSVVPISAGLMWTLVVVGIVVALLIGFFVAAACGYMAGLIGTSASPISGIGILATIISSLVVYFIAAENNLFATQEGVQFATAMAIFMTSVVIAIASISNDNLQDLKTGQLVGATPWRQQIALLLGSVAGAIAIAPVLNLLYQAYGFTGALPRAEMDPNAALSAPQATLMTTIAQGIFNSSMDWDYILIGVGVGVVAIIVNLILKSTTATLTLPPLAVGMGIYLPPTLEVPLIIGSFISYFVGRYLVARAKMRAGELADYDVEQSNRRGVLFASGLIVGESLIGVIIAVIIVLSVTTGGGEAPLELVGPEFESTAQWLGLLAFIFAGLYLVRRVVTHKFNKEEALAMKAEQEQ